MWKIEDLIHNNCSGISQKEGIYKVIVPSGFEVKLNPTLANPAHKPYSIDVLAKKYAASNNKQVLYVGKAKNLRTRIKQYMNYAQCKGKTHKGGRAVFQVEDFTQLYIEVIECENAQREESLMIDKLLPMANMRRGKRL